MDEARTADAKTAPESPCPESGHADNVDVEKHPAAQNKDRRTCNPSDDTLRAVMAQTPAWEGHPVLDCNLVLEGGAMRSLFTAGVLDFLMDKGVVCQRVIGTSAGALCGYNYVAGSTGRTCYINVNFAPDPRYLSLRSFAKTGNAYGRDFSFEEIPNRIEPFDYDAYRRSPIEIVAVSSDLDLGEADYHVIEDPQKDLPYVMASSSMPLVSQIVEIDGKRLLDGGTCDSIPIDYSRSTGAAKHLVVLTQDASYRKGRDKMLAIERQVYGDYPYYLERLEHRPYEYNRTIRRIERMAQAGEAFVIRPERPVGVSNIEHDQEKLFALYEHGVEVAAKAWSALKDYLEIE